MTQDRIYIEGELFLSLEIVAEVYRVEVVWLRQVIDAGLLSGGAVREPAPAIAALRMDHVATIVRLFHALGLDLDAIRDALDESESAE